MLSALKFVRGAVAKKDYVPALTYFSITNGTVLGFNGELALQSPIPLDLVAAPKAEPFVRAIERCDDTAVLHMTDGGRLSVRSGKFQAYVECFDDVDALHDVQPEGTMVQPPAGLLDMVKRLAPITSLDASRPWSNGILLRGQSAFATNNVVLVQLWHGVDFPVELNIPRYAVQELVRIGEEPVGLRIGDRSVTFRYEGNRWLRAQLYADSWPDVEHMFNMEADNKQPMPPGTFEAIETLRPFLGELKHLYFRGGRLCTSPHDGEGASVELEGAPGDVQYHADHLAVLAGVANEIDFTKQPSPFVGEGVRGIILALRQV